MGRAGPSIELPVEFGVGEGWWIELLIPVEAGLHLGPSCGEPVDAMVDCSGIETDDESIRVKTPENGAAFATGDSRSRGALCRGQRLIHDNKDSLASIQSRQSKQPG